MKKSEKILLIILVVLLLILGCIVLKKAMIKGTNDAVRNMGTGWEYEEPKNSGE